MFKALMDQELRDAEEQKRDRDLMWDEGPGSPVSYPPAIFSPCRTWRYVLTRVFGELTSRDIGAPQGMLAVIGLNPSTADEVQNDPTVRRCIGYARDWGFAGLIMLNAFGFRSTDPRGLLKAEDPVGPGNDRELQVWASRAERVVVAWGNHGAFNARDHEIRRILDKAGVVAQCFGLTKEGQPRHPLYLRRDAELVPY